MSAYMANEYKKRRSEYLQVKMTKEDKDKLKRLAKKEEISMANYLVRLLRKEK